MKTYRRTTGIKIGAIVVAVMLFTALILLPLSSLFADLLAADTTVLAAIHTRLFDPSLQAAFLRTAAIALLACALASAVALPAALLLIHGRLQLAVPLTLLGLLALAMPPMLTAAVLRRLDTEGLLAIPQWLTTTGGLGDAELQLIISYALHYLPLLLLTLMATQRDTLHAASDAAHAIGAGRWTTLRRVWLPMAVPGYLLGLTLMLLRMLEDAATPLVLGIDGMLAPRVLHGLLGHEASVPGALLDAALLTAVTGIVVLLAWQILRWPIPVRDAVAGSPAARRPGGAAMIIGLITGAAVVALALLPYAGLALLAHEASTPSQGALAGAAIGDTALAAALKTLLFALFAGLLVMPASALLGVLVATSGWLARWLRGSVTAVLALPSLVLAFAFLQAIRGDGDATLPVNAAWLVLSVVVVLKLLPLGQYLIAARWRSLDREMRPTAQTLGDAANPRFGATAFTAVRPLVLLTFLLATVATLTEVNVALALLQQPDVALVIVLYESVGMNTAWPLPALVFTTGVFGMLALAVLLWHLAGGRRRARGRRRQHFSADAHYARGALR